VIRAAAHFVFTKLNRYGTSGNEVIKSVRYPSCVRRIAVCIL